METQFEQDLVARKDRIIRAMLPDVMFDGWSLASLRAGCVQAGEGADAVPVLFPDGVTGAVLHFTDLGDRTMIYDFCQAGLEDAKVREKITMAIWLRLEAWKSDKDAIRLALAHLAMPSNSVASAKTLFRTVDEMWYLCGDRSADFSYYTRRASLAAVYSATLLYWLNDSSEGHAESRAFLDRRIADVLEFGKRSAQVKKLGRGLPDPFPLLRNGKKLLETGLRLGSRPGFGKGTPCGDSGARRY